MRYEKRGSSARWENGTIITVSEQGVAIEEGEEFTCMPLPGAPLPPIDPAGVSRTAASIAEAVSSSVRIERMVVSEGLAEHRVGTREWREHHQRIHLSLVHGGERALLDFGSFEHDDVDAISEALARCEQEREAPPRLRLASAVSAAVLPLLAGVALPNVELRQTAGGFDGRGLPVVDVPIPGEPWPNWYRPSYRVRPVRMPLQLRLECDVEEIDPDCPVAIALLGPPAGLTLRLLIVDARHAFPATVRITRIDAVSRHRTWYPCGGDAFGAEMML